MLRQANVPTVCLAHSSLMSNLDSFVAKQVQMFRTLGWPLGEENGLHWLNPTDLCLLLVVILNEPKRFIGKEFILTGPSCPSGYGIARILSQFIGEDVDFIEIPVSHAARYLECLGYELNKARSLAILNSSTNDAGKFNDVEHIIEKPPTTLERWLVPQIHKYSCSWIFRSTDIGLTHTNSVLRFEKPAKKNQKAVTLKEAPPLFEILDDETLSEKFQTFLANQYCAENIHFWKEVEKFRKILNSDVLIESAREIVKRFILVGSPDQININHKFRLLVLARMRVGLSRDMFDNIQAQVYTLMEMESYSRFAKESGLGNVIIFGKSTSQVFGTGL